MLTYMKCSYSSLESVMELDVGAFQLISHTLDAAVIRDCQRRPTFAAIYMAVE